jgi:hypothetical protein
VLPAAYYDLLGRLRALRGHRERVFYGVAPLEQLDRRGHASL